MSTTFSFGAAADGTGGATVATTTTPIVASIDALQTLANGDVVERRGPGFHRHGDAPRSAPP